MGKAKGRGTFAFISLQQAESGGKYPGGGESIEITQDVGVGFLKNTR